MSLSFFGLSSLNVGKKISLFTFSLVAVIFVAFVFFISHSASRALEKEAIQSMSNKAKAVQDMIEMFNRAAMGSVERFYKTFASDLKGPFALDPAREVNAGGTPTPVLKNGDVDLNLNFAVVDTYSQKTGVTATIFVKSGDDFVRISTSVKKENGDRAVGTKLDRKHPAYPLLMSGQGYKGVATLFGKPFVTEYQPVKDAAQRVVGVLYVGIDISSEVAALKEKVRALKIGETGFVYVLNAKPGNDFGSMVVHPAQEGKNVLDAKDVDGREYIREILEKQEGMLRYTRIDPALGETAAQERLAVFAANQDWNWVIVGTAFTDEITGEVAKLRNMAFLFGIIALLIFAAVLYVFIGRLVTRPLEKARHAAALLAAGDLTARIAVNSRDEIGEMVQAINGISKGVADVVSQIKSGTEQIVTASTEIASGNQDLSSRTEQQAASLEETASSMEELTSTVKQNADNARQANQLAMTASTVAVKGGDVVSHVVDTMTSINESSKKIVDIIAVEAARAGEQGRGFAVVATEVRSLAQRSAAAAKEIKALISDSVEKVDNGSKLVDKAGATMHEIVESVKRVSDIISEISAASDEQRAGIEQVNQAISQMDTVTQQNAALVEEAAAASESMQEQAAALAQAVAVFRVEGAAPAAPVTSRVPKAPSLHKEPVLQKAPHAKGTELAVASSRRPSAVPASTNDEWEQF